MKRPCEIGNATLLATAHRGAAAVRPCSCAVWQLTGTGIKGHVR